MRKTLFALALVLLPTPLMAQVYADFQTSRGAFTCQLNYTETPKAVANFVTLAEGTRPWLNETTGQVSTTRPAMKFYDGLTFHRVERSASGRLMLGGSRQGDGDDGPGYNFPDEWKESVPASYSFDQPYMLAMYAPGGLNTNGSQFFITGDAMPALEGKYTVFGKVVSGQDVVEDILEVDVDEDDKPVTPVVIQNVVIRRVGREATRFVATRIALPKVTAPRVRPNTQPGNFVALSFNQAAKTVARAYYLPANTSVWKIAGGRFMGPGEKTLRNIIFDSNSIPKADIALTTQYRVGLTTYPADLYTPGVYLNTQLYLENEAGNFMLRFNPTGAFTYMLERPSGDPEEGEFEVYGYSAAGYAGDLTIVTEQDEFFQFHLAPSAKSRTGTITGAQTGKFYNFLYGWVPFEENSNFSWSPLPKVR